MTFTLKDTIVLTMSLTDWFNYMYNKILYHIRDNDSSSSKQTLLVGKALILSIDS